MKEKTIMTKTKKNEKTLAARLAILLIAVIAAVSFTACGDTKTEQPKESAAVQETAAAADNSEENATQEEETNRGTAGSKSICCCS